MRAIVILADGRSCRFGRDNGLVNFRGKLLTAYIVEKLPGLGDECIVSVGKGRAAEQHKRILPNHVLVIQYRFDFEGPLAGFTTALIECKSDLCFLGACDMPFIEPMIVEYLFG